MKKILFTALSVMILIGMTSVAYAADNLFLSTLENSRLGGLSFKDGSIIEYNPTTDTSSLFFDESLFVSGEDIDAFHLLDNGNYLLSTNNNAVLGGLSFTDGDIVEYNPTTDTSSLFFDEGLFSYDTDINALFYYNGYIAMSTQGPVTLGGLAFEDGDIVVYDPATDVAVLIFDEDLFSGNEDIDALHVLSNGNILLSTNGNAYLGGLSFEDGDLVEYNPNTQLASLYFDEDLFYDKNCADTDLDAISMRGGSPNSHTPEPATTSLLILGLFGLVKIRKGRRWKRI